MWEGYSTKQKFKKQKQQNKHLSNTAILFHV